MKIKRLKVSRTVRIWRKIKYWIVDRCSGDYKKRKAIHRSVDAVFKILKGELKMHMVPCTPLVTITIKDERSTL